MTLRKARHPKPLTPAPTLALSLELSLASPTLTRHG
jgi:hypothetical protein